MTKTYFETIARIRLAASDSFYTHRSSLSLSVRENEFRMGYIRQLLPRFRLDIRPTWRTRKEGSEYEGIDYRLFPCCVNHMNLSISSKFATYYLTTMT